jgi:hypothetical protein
MEERSMTEQNLSLHGQDMNERETERDKETDREKKRLGSHNLPCKGTPPMTKSLPGSLP